MDPINTWIKPNAKAIAAFIVSYATAELARRTGMAIPDDIAMAVSALIAAAIVWVVPNTPAPTT